jgi:hypothetical protein
VFRSTNGVYSPVLYPVANECHLITSHQFPSCPQVLRKGLQLMDLHRLYYQEGRSARNLQSGAAPHEQC